MIWEAVIKISPHDAPARRARAIADGIGYAVALLQSEYGWNPERIERLLDDVVNAAYDTQAEA